MSADPGRSARVAAAVHHTAAVWSVFLALALVWHVVVVWSDIHPIILPSPLQVLQAAWEERTTLISAFLATGAAALLGLVSSTVVGFLIAMIFSQSKWLRTAFYPYVVFLQTVPIVAIAPLLIIWFGYGFKTVVLVSTMISLFPIVSNVTAGLISVEENLQDLFRLSAASRWETLVKLQIPYAVSHLILGMRISAGLAVIGAIVGEFFVGAGSSSYAGLGTVMTGWQALTKTAGLIAAVLVSTLLGITILGLVNLITRTLLRRWFW